MTASARSSVASIDEYVFNTHARASQEESSSGFYARIYCVVGDVFSTQSGAGLVPKIVPMSRVNRFTDHAESSLRTAPVSKVTFPSQSPLAPGNGRVFRGEVIPTGRLDRGWLAAIYV